MTWERRRLCLKQRCGTNASALCPAAGSRPKTSRLKKKPFKRRYSCDTARSYNMQPCCSVGHGTRGDTDRPIHTHASIFAAQVSRLVSAHAEASGRADVAEAAAQVCLPQLHRYWAHPCHIYPGPDSPLPHRHRDPQHLVRLVPGLGPHTSAPRLGAGTHAATGGPSRACGAARRARGSAGWVRAGSVPECVERRRA